MHRCRMQYGAYIAYVHVAPLVNKNLTRYLSIIRPIIPRTSTCLPTCLPTNLLACLPACLAAAGHLLPYSCARLLNGGPLLSARPSVPGRRYRPCPLWAADSGADAAGDLAVAVGGGPGCCPVPRTVASAHYCTTFL